jgi:uncharacterized protein (TIGR03545 family)
MGDRELKTKQLAKVVRWKYVVPRLVILFTLATTVRFGLDPLLHYLIVTTGESAVGAKVDLASVETSLFEGRVELRGLQVTNPESPMRNLLEVEQTQLVLDAQALLHKRLVVKNGEISGLEFGTERTESGELEIVIDENAEPSALDPLMSKATEMAADWFDAAADRLDTDFAAQLQTPKVAEELEARWKQQAEALRAKGDDLRARGKQLESEFKAAKSNPLRGMERLPALQTELKTVQQELVALQKEIKNLPNQVKADKATLTAAKQADEAFIKQQLKIGHLDGDNLTQVLLGKPVTENLQNSLDWIGWARKRLPTNSAKQISKQRSRGTEVHFSNDHPHVHIERLGLSLTAEVAGTPTLFTGALTNVSDRPRMIAEPAKLELIANGDLPMTLEVISDRRGDVPREELFLVCAAIPLGGQTMGNAERLAVELAPGTANLRVELVLTGDELGGTIEFTQPKFQVTPITGSRSNPMLTKALGEALTNIDRLQAKVHLAGTIKRPQVKIESPLGRQLADGVGTAVANLARAKSEQLLAGVSTRMNDQFAKLESTKENLQQELLAKMGENQQLMESLAGIASPGGLSPQLGAIGSGLLRK